MKQAISKHLLFLDEALKIISSFIIDSLFLVIFPSFTHIAKSEWLPSSVGIQLVFEPRAFQS